MTVVKNFKSKQSREYWKFIDEAARSIDGRIVDTSETVVFRDSASGQLIAPKVSKSDLPAQPFEPKERK